MVTQLTPNFTLEEMCKSLTAINHGWDNTAKGIFAENLKELCENVLQPVRDHFKLPVQVHSGYRSANVNAATGGRWNSQHLTGEAADIEIPGISNADLWRYIYGALPYDQLIAEYLEKNNPSAGWIHVSYNKVKNRKEAFSIVAPNKQLGGLQYVR